MPKNQNEFGIKLTFTADTEKARMQLEELQNSLTKATKTASLRPFGITEGISDAINKTNQLQSILQKATTESGKLDLGQFRQELSKAGMTAESIRNSLISLGPAGQQAFM